MKLEKYKKLVKYLLVATIILGGAYLILSNNFLLTPKVAHAAKTLHEDLDPATSNVQWLFTIWKTCLALANVFVVIILIFLAAINILHIQYDTYAIKKSLPLLIMGIIMSNFSILICRMIVDAATALTLTFVQDPRKLAEGYLCAIAMTSSGGGADASTGWTIAQGLLVGPTLILVLVLTFLIMIAILILAFLLWIRKTVIFVLTAVSPVAFIMYAFPPTQGLFKQWWGWFLRWTFMGPVITLLMWFAARIGENNCNAFQFSTLLAVIGLTYLAAVMPFKLGGAVMGAWGNFGKKSGKLAGKAAYDNPWAKARRAQSSAKLADWWGSTRIGKSVDQARAKEDWYKGYKEEEAAVRKGRAADRFHNREGRITNYEEQVERQLGLKQYKEQVGDLNLDSREGLSEAFERLEHNKSTRGLRALMEQAAGKAMVSDIMQEANDDLKNKYGAGLFKIENGQETRDLRTDIASQQEFVKRVLMGMSDKGQAANDWQRGDDDLKARNRIQEAWEIAGISGAKNIVRDSSQPSGYRQLDINQPGTDLNLYYKMMIGRSRSGNAQKFLSNVRYETFFDDEGKLHEHGMALLRSFTPDDIRRLGRMRNKVLQGFDKEGNIERLEAQGLTQVADRLRGLGYGKTLGPNKVVIPAPNNRYQEVDIVNLPEDQFNSTVRAHIVGRLSSDSPYTAEQAEDLARNVLDNPNLPADDPFKLLVQGMAELKKAKENLRKINDADAQTTQEILNQVSTTIENEIGNALKNHVEVSPIVNEMIAQAKGPIQAILQERVKNAIARNQTPVISPQGHDIIGETIIDAYEAAKRPDRPGQKMDNFEIQRRFAGMLAAAINSDTTAISGPELDRAWRLVDAYLGKAKKQRESSQREFERILTEQGSLENEELIAEEG